jgi:hypothetical protein
MRKYDKFMLEKCENETKDERKKAEAKKIKIRKQKLLRD